MDVQQEVWFALVGALVLAVLAPMCWRWCKAEEEAFERKLLRRTWFVSRERRRRMRRRDLTWAPPKG